ncbi:2-dehydropantoate 2-reductase N-terminal domain-containing protein [Streptomyces sp. NPDC088182]|uniref:2-dehydropantoate 2-reductase N-terminal domain-containing protein n=1 Tax=Streptomyces sp. NPDC088182 TaxID=3365838 RepID=UPI003810404F
MCGSLFAARTHEAGHDVSLLARGERLTALRRRGVRLAHSSLPLREPARRPRTATTSSRTQRINHVES